MLMKWILPVFCSLIMFKSAAFAQEAKTDFSANSFSNSGRNILWLNGDLGIARLMENETNYHKIESGERQHPYYGIGFAYDYNFENYTFFHMGAEFTRYQIQFSPYDADYLPYSEAYKSEVTTFDPFLGLRFISSNLLSELRIFFDFGIYWSLMNVNTREDHFDDGVYYSHEDKSFSDYFFGGYIGLGSLYKFSDNICSAFSLNFKIPAEDQTVLKTGNEVELDEVAYHPAFFYISFSIGYMF